MSPTLFTVWQFQVQKKFSPETKLQPRAVKIYTFSLLNLMTQLIKVKTPANLVTSCFWTGSLVLVWISHRCSYLGHVGLSWVMWGPHFTLASASHIAAVQGCLLQDNEENGLDHFCNKCKQENRQPGGVYGQRCTQQSHYFWNWTSDVGGSLLICSLDIIFALAIPG